MNWAVILNIAIAAFLAAWGVVQFFLTRTGRKAEVARQQAETEKLIEDRETNARKILAAAQVAAQQVALESSDKRYLELRDDYDRHRIAFNDLRSATEELIEIVEKLVVRMTPPVNGENTIIIAVTPKEYRSARTALRLVRANLW